MLWVTTFIKHQCQIWASDGSESRVGVREGESVVSQGSGDISCQSSLVFYGVLDPSDIGADIGVNSRLLL